MRERRVVVGNPEKILCSQEKRFYMKGTYVEADCLTCNRPLKLDLGERPLSYPVFNQTFEEAIYCDDCEKETTVKLVLRLSLAVTK